MIEPQKLVSKAFVVFLFYKFQIAVKAAIKFTIRNIFSLSLLHFFH